MAVSQFCRLLPGRLFRLGFHYSIAGSEIYLGESLLFLLVLSVCALVLLRSGRLFYRVFAVCSGVLLLSVCTLFLLVLIRSGRTNILSVPIPFLGGTVTSWAVDMTCLCTAVVYMYLSICAFQTTPRNCRFGRTCGLAGTVLALAVFLVLIIPDVLSSGQLAPGDYLVLMLWSLAGMLYYHGALVRDRENRLGKSMIMWLMMFFFLFFATTM